MSERYNMIGLMKENCEAKIKKAYGASIKLSGLLFMAETFFTNSRRLKIKHMQKSLQIRTDNLQAYPLGIYMFKVNNRNNKV